MARKAQQLVTAIILKRAQRRVAGVIIEGSDDRLAIGAFVDRDRASIEVADGKETLLEAIAIAGREGIDGVLGIADANAFRLPPPRAVEQNVVLTDHHDLESMMMHSGALERVLHEFASPDKRVAIDVLHTLRDAVAPMGYLRWLNHLENLGLRFDGLSLGDFVDSRSLALDVTRLIAALRMRSERMNVSQEYITRRMTELQQLAPSLSDLCHGKDLVSMLGIGLRHRWGSRNAAETKIDVLSRALRLSFSARMFRETRLYDAILRWERANPLFRILKGLNG